MEDLRVFLGRPSRKRDLWIALLIPVVIVGSGILMLVISAVLAGIGYFCPLNGLFGIRCVGCGATRATICLISGRFCEAFWYNPFYIVLLILPLFYYCKFFFGAIRKNYTPFRFGFRVWYWYIFLALGLIFMLLRNLPFYRAFFY